jgi:RND family efflux transporter MFP subunit
MTRNGLALALPAALSLLLVGACRRESWEWAPPTQPVRTEVVRAGPHQATLVLFGAVRPAETVPLVAPASGQVTFPPRFAGGLLDGAAVSQGETILWIENEPARLRLTEARLEAEAAEDEFRRAEKGLAEGVFTKADFTAREMARRLAKERLASAERDSKRLALSTPRGGTLIVSNPLASGATIGAGGVAAELAVAGKSRIEASAAAADRASLSPGLAVRFHRPGSETPAGEGTIREVGSVVDSGGTVRVGCDVVRDLGMPAPGEGIEVRVLLAARSSVLTIPEDSLLLGSDGESVFLAEQSNEGAKILKVRKVRVELGGRGGGRIEVRRGLEEGDRIVVSGAALVGDGALVTDVPAAKPASAASSAAAPGTAAPTK